MHNAQLLKKRILYIVHFRFKQSSLYALGGYYYFVMKKEAKRTRKLSKFRCTSERAVEHIWDHSPLPHP